MFFRLPIKNSAKQVSPEAVKIYSDYVKQKEIMDSFGCDEDIFLLSLWA
jgi:hypothetical protein